MTSVHTGDKMNFQQISDRLGKPVHNFQQVSDLLDEPVYNFQQVNDALDRREKKSPAVSGTVAAAIARARAAAGL